MKTPLISIIIPIYNCSNYLVRCLESVKNQTYSHLEILLIDDGSTDESGRIGEEYAAKDSRFQIFHQKNQGVSRARNFGLGIFQGEYLAFLDADDFIEEQYIERLYFALTCCKTKLAVCSAFDCRQESISEYHYEKNVEPVRIDMADYDYTKPYAHKVVWGALYEKSLVKDLCFDTEIFLGEDSLFFAEVLNRCEDIAFLEEKRYVYMLYKSSASHGNYDWKKQTEIKAAQKVKALFSNRSKRFQSKVNAWYCCVCLRGLKCMAIYDCINKERYSFLLKEARSTLFDVLGSSCAIVTKITSLLWCVSPTMGSFVFKILKMKI